MINIIQWAFGKIQHHLAQKILRSSESYWNFVLRKKPRVIEVWHLLRVRIHLDREIFSPVFLSPSFPWLMKASAGAFLLPVEHCYLAEIAIWLLSTMVEFWNVVQQCRKNKQRKREKHQHSSVQDITVCFPIEVAACRMMTLINASNYDETHNESVEHCETVGSFANSAHTNICTCSCRSLPNRIF